MNAYELADELHEDLQWIVTSNTDLPSRLASAINMLRQQADRIAELENAKQFIQNFAEEQHRRACALEEFQTKPLSNNEILEMTIWNKNLYELYVEMEKEDMIAFARAIEERHGIK